jgi:hypothetical protein
MSINFYNPGDQAIYDSGLSFIPQSQFRLGNPRMLMPGGIADTDVAANVLRPPVPFIPSNTGGAAFRDDDDDEIDRSNNLGINSLRDAFGTITSNLPGTIGFNLAGIPGFAIGSLIGRGFSNIGNQYTDVFGRINQRTLDAIKKDYDRSQEARAAREAFATTQRNAFRSRHGQEGSGGGPGSGANEGGSGADSGSGTHSDPGD